MKIFFAKWWIFVVIFIGEASFALQATFEPAANNTIYEDNPTYASGQSSYLFMGPIASGSPRRALLRFDVSSLPANTQITHATLSLTIDRAARNSDTDDPVAVHRVLASWGQGTSNAGSGGSGTQASAGDSTWSARFYNSPPGVPSLPWNVPGGDFAPASATQNLGVTIGQITLASTSALVNDVQTWLADPTSNNGWILVVDEGEEYKARRFYGRNAFAPGDRPKLTVTYDVVEAGDSTIPTLSGWAMMLLALGIMGIARKRL